SVSYVRSLPTRRSSDLPVVQQARTRIVAALFPEFGDGLPDQGGGAQDIDLGFHVRQRRRNELVAFLAERRADVSLGQLLGLHNDVRTDLEGLLEHQRQQQRDQCEQQENPLDQSPVHEQYSQEVVQIVFHSVHDSSLISRHLCYPHGRRS